MAKRRIFDLVDVHHQLPRTTYNKILEVKKTLVNPTGRSVSINKTLCFCLNEYFQMKEAEEDHKKAVVL